jgi:hypothetical protein
MLVCFLFLGQVIGCGSSVAILGNNEWAAQKENTMNRTATVFVANVDFKCKLVSATSDKIVVQANGSAREIPREMITKIVIADDNRNSHPVLGATIGGVAGIGVGYVVGHAAASSKSVSAALFHPLGIVSILGGIVAGELIGAGSSHSQEFSFKKTVKRYILNPEVGPEITPMELRAFSLFNDLPANADEKVLQVQLFQLSDGKYFLLYDVSELGNYNVKWRVVDDAYVKKESAKIK